MSDLKEKENKTAAKNNDFARKQSKETVDTSNQLSKDFMKELGEKRQIHEKRINDNQKKFNLIGGIGKDKVEMLKIKQINSIRNIAREKENKFLNMLDEQKKSRFRSMLGEAETEMSIISDTYNKIIDFVRGLDKVDEEGMLRLESIMEAMSKMRSNPQMESIFKKALNKSKLSEKEITYLADSITPLSIDRDMSDGEWKSNKIFEASQLGAILSVLKGSPQYMELLKTIIRRKGSSESVAIFEVFLTVGALTELQLQSLIQGGFLKGPEVELLKRKMENGEIMKNRKKYQDTSKFLSNKYRGRSGENPMNKVLSGPMGMAVAGLWGAAVALANLKAGWKGNDGIGKNLANAATNPYVLGGLAVAAGGVVVAGPAIAPETFSKYREKFLDFWRGPEEKREILNIKKDELNKMLENELSQNIYLLYFLEEKETNSEGKEMTGLEVIKNMVREQRLKHGEVNFKLSEITKHCGNKQKSHLMKSLNSLGGDEARFEDSLKAVMAAIIHLKLDTPANFAAYARNIKNKQGIK